jgi:hypothetical protein
MLTRAVCLPHLTHPSTELSKSFQPRYVLHSSIVTPVIPFGYPDFLDPSWHVRVLARLMVPPSLPIFRRPRYNPWACEGLAARWVRFTRAIGPTAGSRGRDAAAGPPHPERRRRGLGPAPNGVPQSGGFAGSSAVRCVAGTGCGWRICRFFRGSLRSGNRLGWRTCRLCRRTGSPLGGSGKPTPFVAHPAPLTARPAAARNALLGGSGKPTPSVARPAPQRQGRQTCVTRCWEGRGMRRDPSCPRRPQRQGRQMPVTLRRIGAGWHGRSSGFRDIAVGSAQGVCIQNQGFHRPVFIYHP